MVMQLVKQEEDLRDEEERRYEARRQAARLKRQRLTEGQMVTPNCGAHVDRLDSDEKDM